MSYSISLSGHGADVDDLKEVFENTVRALRAITPPDAGNFVSGSGGGSTPDGTSFTLSASDVVDVSEPADAEGDADQPLPGDDDGSTVDHREGE